MKITKTRLKRIVKEEIEALEYELVDQADDLALDNEMVADVESLEDAWSNGTLQHSIDHLDAAGSEDLTVKGVESLKITESQLRKIVKHALVEQAEDARMHRTFSGDLVPFGSDECIGDLCNRMDDATATRNSCGARTDKRDYYNGVLKVLRRDMRDAQKMHTSMYPVDEEVV